MTKMPLRPEMFIVLIMVPTLVPALSMFRVRSTSKSLMMLGNGDLSVVHYLVKYGHLGDRLDARNQLRSQKGKITTKDSFHPYSEDDVREGIKSFQNSFGLIPTGYMNEKTTKAMKSPRCGLPDKGESENKSPIKVTLHARVRRQVTLQGGKWHKDNLQWTIYRYYQSSKLSISTQINILGKAFKIWEYSSALKFTRTTNRHKADIVIQFLSGDHGDYYDFDGQGNILAHAYYPNHGGDIHFDSDERWEYDTDLLNVAVHEIGHSLGLSHSNIYNSIMYPKYYARSSVVLDADDKNKIIEIYGPCETKLDGATSRSGRSYFFRDDLVWKIDDLMSDVLDGYPKRISDEFPNSNIPTPIDSSLVWSVDNMIYFLKGRKSFGYNIHSKKVIYNNTIAYDWPGVPDMPDASFCDVKNQYTYFFKGDQYWRFDDYYFKVDDGYPKKISSGWFGIPNDLDAALFSEWYNKIYFFKGTQYWQFDPDKNHGFLAGLIRNKWKNVCSAKY